MRCLARKLLDLLTSVWFLIGPCSIFPSEMNISFLVRLTISICITVLLFFPLECHKLEEFQDFCQGTSKIKGAERFVTRVENLESTQISDYYTTCMPFSSLAILFQIKYVGIFPEVYFQCFKVVASTV
ncbi:CMF_collapsed_G0013520.mRNA.1.CDS.1 [Saccharomyces cerevisiae]|nr:CMF_collapsed_G0013520.mRNA.1.CDS.1 [Saccharomyces cerevisiae]